MSNTSQTLSTKASDIGIALACSDHCAKIRPRKCSCTALLTAKHLPVEGATTIPDDLNHAEASDPAEALEDPPPASSTPDLNEDFIQQQLQAKLGTLAAWKEQHSAWWKRTNGKRLRTERARAKQERKMDEYQARSSEPRDLE
jgi:hypothetical protein